MSSFIKNLIDRHLLPEQNVKPRLASRFERTDRVSWEPETGEGIRISETIPENPFLNANEEVSSGIISGENLSLFNHPQESINIDADIESDRNDNLPFGKSTEKPITEERRELISAKNGALVPEQIRIAQANENLNTVPLSFSSEPTVSLNGLVPDNQHFQQEPPRFEGLEFTNLNLSDSSDQAQVHELENVFLVRAKIQKEKAEKEQSGQPSNPYSFGTKRQGNVPDFKRDFDPILNAPAQPVIKVTIGQIKIRAEVQKAAPVLRTKQTRLKPKMSLDDYLKKQNDQTR